MRAEGPSRSLTTTCRARMEEELIKTEEGKQRIQQAQDRQSEVVAEDLKKRDEEKQYPPETEAGAAVASGPAAQGDAVASEPASQERGDVIGQYEHSPDGTDRHGERELEQYVHPLDRPETRSSASTGVERRHRHRKVKT